MLSLLIIAIGALGVVTLQSTSLQSNNGAYLRTQATFFAGDYCWRYDFQNDGKS
ncbi:MAG: hypothetical protein CMQ21_14780 [Gammaproteobacteria bacterium]|nr:hypothetical protein [Gammaproteobacteria bacterium]